MTRKQLSWPELMVMVRDQLEKTDRTEFTLEDAKMLYMASNHLQRHMIRPGVSESFKTLAGAVKGNWGEIDIEKFCRDVRNGCDPGLPS